MPEKNDKQIEDATTTQENWENTSEFGDQLLEASLEFYKKNNPELYKVLKKYGSNEKTTK